ncbi:hypothetical protein CEXT_369771 [Caerostris extrusa]|uniref:Uncharacterized protein n=1 Tax=Caerostris extrusa TaxID=172846 RepID=A0AAV4UNX4_CAEEX|nr:hypothetical protein CEXT_369771 [Caerostris extrusa]
MRYLFHEKKKKTVHRKQKTFTLRLKTKTPSCLCGMSSFPSTDLTAHVKLRAWFLAAYLTNESLHNPFLHGQPDPACSIDKEFRFCKNGSLKNFGKVNDPLSSHPLSSGKAEGGVVMLERVATFGFQLRTRRLDACQLTALLQLDGAGLR